jgi:hypothetical protein
VSPTVTWLDRRIARPGPYLTLCLTEEQYLKALKRLGVKYPVPWIANNADATAHYYSHPENHHTVAIVCITNCEKQSPVEIAGLLVHEAVHVWQRYCRDIGEDFPGAEQEAYAIQAISQELFDSFEKQKGKA